jgi:membrane-bound serine protease (ClpP class)
LIEPWVWSIILLAVGLSLAIMEVFFPSAGLIGFLSACSIIAAVVLAFRQGSTVGLAVLSGTLLAVPIVVALALKFWPKTAMGRRMLLSPPESNEILPDLPHQRQLKTLIGRIGQTKSKMLPSGAVLIDGQTIDATSEGVPIEVDKRVRVIAVRANRVVVRPVDDEVPDQSAENPLARPIDSISPDPFGDSPA